MQVYRFGSEVRNYDPVVPIQPVIEGGPGAFLPDSPFNLRVTKPWILGVTSQDGAMKTAGKSKTSSIVIIRISKLILVNLYISLLGYISDPNLKETFSKKAPRTLPTDLMFENTTADAQHVTRLILDRYIKEDFSFHNLTDVSRPLLFSSRTRFFYTFLKLTFLNSYDFSRCSYGRTDF